MCLKKIDWTEYYAFFEKNRAIFGEEIFQSDGKMYNNVSSPYFEQTVLKKFTDAFFGIRRIFVFFFVLVRVGLTRALLAAPAPNKRTTGNQE